MKTSASSRQSGVALVLVLSFLALITIIVTAFFFSITAQVSLTDAVSVAATTDQLADSAVNVVMAQIVDATKGVDDTGASKTYISWASQPGMLRTYTSTPSPSNATTRSVYKLYSSDKMVVKDFHGEDTAALANWKKPENRDIYTDLNAPLLDASGKLVYPIVDPAADGKSSTGGSTATVGTGVDGFSITEPPGFDGGDEGPTNNRAPMPVKWLYMLKDGSLKAPASGTSKAVTVTDATATNPIVGRVAFWTDDETGKININTASEGTYWDMPRVWTAEDFGTMNGVGVAGLTGMAVTQPTNHEFQRYPGHPATTCLSPVFGPLAGMTVDYPSPSLPDANYYKKLIPYYNMAPRIGLTGQQGGGGSQGGSVLYPNVNTGITVDNDRLYATIDELLYSAAPLNGGQRVQNAVNPNDRTPRITRDVLEKARFFITANSSAPEVTLYNTPRVSIWPIALSTAKRSGFDNLSSFCSTIKPGATATAGAGGYYFTRNNPQSLTEDYSGRNVQLYQYLKKMTSTPIPGFGGTFQGKYGAITDPAVLASVPSLRGVTECDQILTEIFDYIRCTNIQDKSVSATSVSTKINYAPIHTYPGPIPGSGEVLPIRIGSTQGFGRYYTFSKAVLVFYCTSVKMDNTSNPPKPVTPIVPLTMKAVFYLVPTTPAQGLGPMFSDLHYTVSGLDKLTVQFFGSQAAATSLLLPATSTNYYNASDIDSLHGRSIGGTEQPVFTLARGTSGTSNKNFVNSGANNTDPNTYPFISSGEITIPTDTTVDAFFRRFFDFHGNGNNSVVVTIASARGETVQTLRFNFPDSLRTASGGQGIGGFRVPRNISAKGLYPVRNFVGDSYALVDGDKHYEPPLLEPSQPGLDSNGTTTSYGMDTVVCLEIAGNPGGTTGNLSADYALDGTAGDARMIAGLSDVPSTRFRAHNNWRNKGAEGTAYAHSVLLSIGDYLRGGQYGNLVRLDPAGNPNLQVAATRWYQQTASDTGRQPDVPSRARYGVFRKDGGVGDWDAGWGDQKDGAHINKTDEGDTAFGETTGSGYRTPYSLGYHKGYASGENGFFSPTRMIPSAMMFGSLPTGVLRMLPWQTLSFAPRTEDPGHPGTVAPKDHLLADLFWMPVVEPWPISQPFATAGKINLNYQIQPFTYIERQTGLWAVLKATKIGRIPVGQVKTYKPLDGPGNRLAQTANIRKELNLNLTMPLIGGRFSSGDLYRSATEICDITLVPVDAVGGARGMANYWKANALTGDNLREKPYADIYPRLTTKSNTYSVHVRVQSLKKARSTPPNQWVFGVDTVAGDYRGTTILERYIDLNDPNLPDFATAFTGDASTSPNLDSFYKMRVVSTRRFSP